MIPTIVFLSILIGFIIGRVQLKLKFKKILNKGTGRYGIIKFNTLKVFFIEIEELETAGEFTKVRIIKIHPSSDIKRSKKELIESISFNNWTRTSEITWFDSNSQKLRDEKLKQILK